MPTTIKLKNGSGAPLAGDLVQGEPALDLTNKRLYTEDSGGTVIEVGTNPSTLTTSTITGSGDMNIDSGTLFVDASENKVGIGTTSPLDLLHINSGSNVGYLRLTNSSGDRSYIGVESGEAVLYAQTSSAGNMPMAFHTGITERMRIDSSGNVGIGTTSPDTQLHVATGHIRVNGTLAGGATLQTSGSGGLSTISSNDASNPNFNFLQGTNNTGVITFSTRASSSNQERMRIDNSGNLLVGTTDTPSGRGIRGGGGFAVGNSNTGIYCGAFGVYPAVDLALSDNDIDLGNAVYRWDDVFATNGTIQTSDRNEKQDIEELTEAEQRVAVAAKSLMRKFRWKSAVENKGDDARIHFGIIAQDLQAAFEAEGLDAGRYAMFIYSEWWETYTDVPAVEAQDAVYETVVIPAVTEERLVSEAVLDEEGNEIEEAVYETVVVQEETTEERLVSEAVEAKEAYTRTDTYSTEEEAPEGAVKKSRMGVRYSELLAFIIAAI